MPVAAMLPFGELMLFVAPNVVFSMAMRAFEEEAGLYDPDELITGLSRSISEGPLEGLSAPEVILFETAQAVAAALAAGVLLCAFLQGLGAR